MTAPPPARLDAPIAQSVLLTDVADADRYLDEILPRERVVAPDSGN